MAVGVRLPYMLLVRMHTQAGQVVSRPFNFDGDRCEIRLDIRFLSFICCLSVRLFVCLFACLLG